jgi:hypothetical protein
MVALLKSQHIAVYASNFSPIADIKWLSSFKLRVPSFPLLYKTILRGVRPVLVFEEGS